MVKDNRQGYAILATMATIFVASFVLLTVFELAGAGTAPELAGGAMEGKEQRFGVVATTLFSTSSTATSTGAVNSMHDSFTALGGMMPLVNMMTGEVAPGGVGSGLYGMLVMAIFWLGTVPALVAIGLGAQRVFGPLRRRLPTLGALTVMVMGLLALSGRLHTSPTQATPHNMAPPDHGTATLHQDSDQEKAR